MQGSRGVTGSPGTPGQIGAPVHTFCYFKMASLEHLSNKGQNKVLKIFSKCGELKTASLEHLSKAKVSKTPPSVVMIKCNYEELIETLQLTLREKVEFEVRCPYFNSSEHFYEHFNEV